MHLGCLNVIKGVLTQFVGQAVAYTSLGKPMRMDVCSISQGDKRVFSTLAQALGLLADVDLGKGYPRLPSLLRHRLNKLQ